jgi:hypothetical protein
MAKRKKTPALIRIFQRLFGYRSKRTSSIGSDQNKTTGPVVKKRKRSKKHNLFSRIRLRLIRQRLKTEKLIIPEKLAANKYNRNLSGDFDKASSVNTKPTETENIIYYETTAEAGHPEPPRSYLISPRRKKKRKLSLLKRLQKSLKPISKPVPAKPGVLAANLVNRNLKDSEIESEGTEILFDSSKIHLRKRKTAKSFFLSKIRKIFRKRKKRVKFTGKELAANYVNRNLNPGFNPENDNADRKPGRSIAHRHRLRRVRSNQPQEGETATVSNEISSVNLIKSYVRRIDLRAMFNSTGLFLVSYLIIYLIYQLPTILVASVYKIDSVLYFYELYFPVGNASNLWTKTNIIAITLIGPVASGFTALLLFRWVQLRNIKNHIFRLLLLWVAFQGAAHFLGAFVAGIITDLGFGYVANWLFLNVFFKILISLVFLSVLSLAGYYSATTALANLPHGRMKSLHRTVSLISTYLLPWLLGTTLLVLLRFPDKTPQHENIMVYDAIIMISMVFAIVPMVFRKKSRGSASVVKGKRVSLLNGILMFAAGVAIVLLFRIILINGLYFAIRFSFSTGFYN